MKSVTPNLAAYVISVAAALCACSRSGVPAKNAAVETSSTAFGPVVIDRMLRDEWTKQGITPTPHVDDARFIRRMYLDVVGTIPPREAVDTYVSDRSTTKREKLVDSLLASPAYAEHWANYWEETLVGVRTKEQVVDRAAFRAWLENAFATNVPWNKIVVGLVTAEGRNSQGGRRTMADVTANADAGLSNAESNPPDNTPVNGAVNWFLKYKDAPQDLAGSASRVFLGVQIQCAQCHDHKTESWTQNDFRKLTACFVQTRADAVDKGKTMGTKRIDVADIGRPLPRFQKNPELSPYFLATPTALDGTSFAQSRSARAALASWMTAPSNPWFANEIVNRMWGHFLGRGFVNPVDDLRPSNPPTMPELLDKMSADFVARGYDLKNLVRTIVLTEAYQLAPTPRAGLSPPLDKAVEKKVQWASDRLWSHFHMTPLGPEELLRAIMDATGVGEVLDRKKRGDIDRIREQLYQQYTFLFDIDEEEDQVDFEGTISQALTLLNGSLVAGGTSAIAGSALDSLLKETSPDSAKIQALYVRTIARKPTPVELGYWIRYVNDSHVVDSAPTLKTWGAPSGGKIGKSGNVEGPQALDRLLTNYVERQGSQIPPRRRAYEDLFWALLNSSEFTFNH